MMKVHFASFTFILTALAFFLQGCQSYAPVNSSFDRAGTLRKGEMEIAVNYSGYYNLWGGYPERSNDNFGLRLGFGIGEKTDLKFRYENLNDPGVRKISGFHYFSMTPKFSLKRDVTAISVPVGMYLDPFETYIFTSPSFHFTHRFGRVADITFTQKVDMFLGGLFFSGTQLGIGLSTNTDKWALRPEVGWMTFLLEPGEQNYLTWGLGLMMNF